MKPTYKQLIKKKVNKQTTDSPFAGNVTIETVTASTVRVKGKRNTHMSVSIAAVDSLDPLCSKEVQPGFPLRTHSTLTASKYNVDNIPLSSERVEELCESRGGRPGLSVLMSLTVSVDVKGH